MQINKSSVNLSFNARSLNAMFRLQTFGSNHFDGRLPKVMLYYNTFQFPSSLITSARCAVSFIALIVGRPSKFQFPRIELINNTEPLRVFPLDGGKEKENRCSFGTCGKAFYLATRRVEDNLIKFVVFYGTIKLIAANAERLSPMGYVPLGLNDSYG